VGGTRQGFGKNIGNIEGGGDPLRVKKARVDMLANKVIVYIDVLGAGVPRTLLGDSNCTSIVDPNSERLSKRQDTLTALRE
jgi:hypothetical protein